VREGEGEDPSIGLSGEKVGLTPRSEIQQVLEALTSGKPPLPSPPLPSPQEGLHQGLSAAICPVCAYGMLYASYATYQS
jgi:hypothetical protein